jgi:hypothetical protein
LPSTACLSSLLPAFPCLVLLFCTCSCQRAAAACSRPRGVDLLRAAAQRRALLRMRPHLNCARSLPRHQPRSARAAAAALAAT